MKKKLRRSWLLTLTTDDRKVQKAAESSADVLILDLTDSVTPELKHEARRRVVDWLKGSHPFGDKQVAVKPNNLWSEWGRDDLEAISSLRMDVLYYPEARSADEVRMVQRALDEAGSQAEIAVLLETPQSFLEIRELAAVPRVTAFNHAQGDLSVNLGVALTDSRETLLYTASQLVLVARAYGLLAIDTALPSDLRDAALSRRYIESSRRMGFQASSTFYAPHVDAINAVFSPGEKQLAEAREIIAEYEKVKKTGRAAYVRPDGRWVTVHQFRQALEMLEQFG
ncbi:MAG: CoA ester lyase [Betaproteobacteria bacterium]|nr:MAG: CoA ester lyase [Betaproteobacteria bacterium]